MGCQKMKTFLTVMGMYQYDKTLFDLFVIPSSMKSMRDNIIDMICLETQELEVLLPYPPVFRESIGCWCNSMLSIWEKLYTSTTLEYNPIENYDRTETTTETEKRTDSLSSTTENTSNSEDITQNVAYNNTDFTNNEKTMSNVDGQMKGNANNVYDTVKTYSNRAHGNIGVTTSQQMIESERKVVQFNMVQYIVDDFKQRFCLMVY